MSYTYYKIGHVANITIKDEYPDAGDPNDFDWYRDLALYYTSDHKLWRVLWDRWKLDGEGEVTDYQKLAAREFCYDGPRQRWLARDIDPNLPYPGYWDVDPNQPQPYTDYLGQMPYADGELIVTWDEGCNYLHTAVLYQGGAA